MVSIIIPYHNEGKEFISQTLESIDFTCDITYEVIIVDDGSEVPLEISGIKVLRHERNLGVGQAFDTGVKEAKYDNLFLMGCDVRFVENKWGSLMLSEIENYPESLTCSTTVSLYMDRPEVTFEFSRQLYKYNGATILFLHGHSDTPDRPDNFHSILNAQWLPREYIKLMPPTIDEGDPFAQFLKESCNIEYSRTHSYEVPCILGAFYGCRKSWYQYLDGFWGHKSWGTLEPYISLKSWLFGGSCRTAHIETGHIFKSDGTHKTPFADIAYNKLLVSWLLFNKCDRERLINWLPDHDYIIEAKKMIEGDLSDIFLKREEYRAKIIFSTRNLCKKFNLKFYED